MLRHWNCGWIKKMLWIFFLVHISKGWLHQMLILCNHPLTLVLYIDWLLQVSAVELFTALWTASGCVLSLCTISDWLCYVGIIALWRLDHLLQDSLFFLSLKIVFHGCLFRLVALFQNDCSSYSWRLPDGTVWWIRIQVSNVPKSFAQYILFEVFSTACHKPVQRVKSVFLNLVLWTLQNKSTESQNDAQDWKKEKICIFSKQTIFK